MKAVRRQVRLEHHGSSTPHLFRSPPLLDLDQQVDHTRDMAPDTSCTLVLRRNWAALTEHPRNFDVLFFSIDHFGFSIDFPLGIAFSVRGTTLFCSAFSLSCA